MTPGSTFPLSLSEGDSQDSGHQTTGSPRSHRVSDFGLHARNQNCRQSHHFLSAVPAYLDPVPITCLAKT